MASNTHIDPNQSPSSIFCRNVQADSKIHVKNTWMRTRKWQLEYGVSFGGNKNVPKLTLVVATHIYEYRENHAIVPFKWLKVQ